jgi:GYF domain 2
MMSWHISRNGKVRGPFTESEIFELIGKRQIDGNDYARRDDAGEWLPLGAVREFSTSFAPVATAAPVPAPYWPPQAYPAPAVPWYQSTAVGVLSILFCWPLGLMLLLTNPRASASLKLVVAGGFAGLLVLGGVGVALAGKHAATAATIRGRPPGPIELLPSEQHAADAARAAGSRVPTRAGPSSVDAWVAAQDFVKRDMKSPSTADFGSIFGEHQDSRECCHELSGGNWRCTGWVDGQNAFGATGRADFSVTMKPTGEGSWTVVDGPNIENR